MNSSMKKLFWATVAVAIAGSNSGCNSGTAAPPPPPLAITVSVAPIGAQTIDQGQSKNFTGNVGNDSSNKGVNWTLTQNGTACSPGCGTIAPASTASGVATTYTAPAAINANLQLNVTATSVADSTKSASDSTTAVPPPALNNPAQLPAATVGQAYSYTLTEAGGVPPFTWSIISGSLPAGLALSSSGVISGTAMVAAGTTVAIAARPGSMTQPLAATTSTFTVQALDSGVPQLKATQALTMLANPAPVAPSITTQPANQTVTVGQMATFSVVATGTAPLSYQWQKNGVNISGATAANYTTPATTTADNSTQYKVTVSNAAGTVTSAAATLTVNAVAVAPTITTQPMNQTVTVGQMATFSVLAAGTTPLSYQWQKNGVNISGATAAIYTTPATTTADNNAQYKVTVSNTAGTVTSAAATLTVNAAAVAPTITTQPVNQTVTVGQTATFSVVAAGTTPLSYQWQKVVGATVTNVGTNSTVFTITATTPADNGAKFHVKVSNAVGNVTSSDATLTVNPLPSLKITTPSPLPNGTGSTGTAYNATLQATGGVTSYAWSAVGLPPGLSIATNADSTATISGNPSRGGVFPLVVTVKDSAGSPATDSKNYTLTIPCIYHTTPNQAANENASLKGVFTFRFSGFGSNVHAVARVGSFSTDGNTVPTLNNGLGTITTGEEDVATGASSGASFRNEALVASSSYCIGNNQGRLGGTLTLNTATSSVAYSITLAGQSGSLIEFDPVDNVRGSGILKPQAAPFVISASNYVFGFTGRDSNNGPASVAGVFNITSSLSGITGEDDFIDPGVNPIANPPVNNNPISVAFAATPPNTANRTTGKLTAAGNATATGEIDFVAYGVSSQEFFVVNNGSGTNAAPILSGEIFSQNLPQPLDATALNALAIFYLAGVDPSSPSSGQTAATIGLVSFTGGGSIRTLELDADIGGTITGPVTAATGTYTVASNGRAFITPPAGVNFSPIAYLSDVDSGVLLDFSPGAGLGRIFKHLFVLANVPTFGVINDLPPAVPGSTVASGEIISGGSTSLNWIQDVDSPTSGLTFDVLSGTLPLSALDSLNGRFTVGTCPPTPALPVCQVGYGFYGTTFTTGPGEILIDETGANINHPVIVFWGSLP